MGSTLSTLSTTAGTGPGAATNVATLRVTAKELVAEDVLTLELAAPDGARLRDWAPGSHVDLVLPTGLTRQYSLCGNRWDPFHYRVGVLREQFGRGGSAWVHEELGVGDLVGVGGPRNNFPLVPAEHYLFVAGGIGITPLLPMVRQADLMGADWRLLYGARRQASLAFLPELEAYGDRVQVVTRDQLQGRGSTPSGEGPGMRHQLSAFLGAPRDGTKVYCCGPASMMAAVEAACADWPAYSVRVERFVGEEIAIPVRQAPFEVELARTGRTVIVTPDQSVLDAVGAAGAELLSSCRQGICGTCEATVLDGVPDHRDALLDDRERAANDCMFTCVSRARSERLVLDL